MEILNYLLQLNPEKISHESNEESIFFTFFIGNLTFFLTHYYDGEAILAYYRINEKMPSFAGSIEEVLHELNLNDKENIR